IGSRIQTADAVRDIVPGSEDENGAVIPLTAEGAAHLEAVHPGHHDIKNHDLGMFPLNNLQCLNAILCSHHVVPIEGQGTPQRLTYRWFIVYDQNFHLHTSLVNRK